MEDRKDRVHGGVWESIEELEEKLGFLERNEEHVVSVLSMLVPMTIAHGAWKWMISMVKISLATKIDAREFGDRLQQADQRIKDINTLLRAGTKPKTREEEV